MNVEFFNQFGRTSPTLPLNDAGQITNGNACLLDWEKVCPKNTGDEIYILGNPPYLGSALQTESQKMDMKMVFNNGNYKKLDYIASWFLKAAYFINKTNHKFAFVSTNSICQGEQVHLLWTELFALNLEISFAYRSFKWKNNAKQNAGVVVVIVGIRSKTESEKYLFDNYGYSVTKNINPYLVSASNTFITPRHEAISDLPKMMQGSAPTDDGNLLFDEPEKIDLIHKYPHIAGLFKSYIGANEFVNSINRYW